MLRPRASGETVRVELDWFIRRDGSFVPVSYASSPMVTPEGRGAVVVFRDVRDLANGMHPLELSERGIAVALEDLTAGLPIPVDLDVTEERFAPEVEATAYFTVAEALTNVLKHAGADAAEVSIRRDHGSLTIEVADDGRGGADPGAGSGLRGPQDRLSVLGGSLEILTSGEAGTRLRAYVPL